MSSDPLRCQQHTGDGPILTLVRSHPADGAWVEHYTCPICPAAGHITRPHRNGAIDKRFGPAVNPQETVGAAHTNGGDSAPATVPDGGHASEFRLTCEDCNALDETYDTYSEARYWSGIHGDAGHVPRIEEHTLATDGGTREYEPVPWWSTGCRIVDLLWYGVAVFVALIGAWPAAIPLLAPPLLDGYYQQRHRDGGWV